MFKKLLNTTIVFILLLLPLNLVAESEAETCTYTEGMFICMKITHGKKLIRAYCNYQDSNQEIEKCQKRIRNNHKYESYYKKQWKAYCEKRPFNRRTEFCQKIKTDYEFYLYEFLKLFEEKLGIKYNWY